MEGGPPPKRKRPDTSLPPTSTSSTSDCRPNITVGHEDPDDQLSASTSGTICCFKGTARLLKLNASTTTILTLQWLEDQSNPTLHNLLKSVTKFSENSRILSKVNGKNHKPHFLGKPTVLQSQKPSNM